MGICVGRDVVGVMVGAVGAILEALVGKSVGDFEGSSVGSVDGYEVGSTVGSTVGGQPVSGLPTKAVGDAISSTTSLFPSIHCNDTQSAKAYAFTTDTDVGIVIFCMDMHPSNADTPMEIVVEGMANDCKDVQW